MTRTERIGAWAASCLLATLGGYVVMAYGAPNWAVAMTVVLAYVVLVNTARTRFR